jgi:hypothetical protein
MDSHTQAKLPTISLPYRETLATFIPVLTMPIAMSLIANLDSPVNGWVQDSQQSMQVLSDDLHMQFSTKATGW